LGGRPSNFSCSTVSCTLTVKSFLKCLRFFTAYKGYHDGGLGGHNNPVNLAIWEQNWIWDREGKPPDFVLSLGTGSKAHNNVAKETTLSQISQLFLPRLMRSFMALLNGVSGNLQQRYHRLNVSFLGSEPQLDDLSCIRDLKQQTINNAEAKPTDLIRCADNMLASLFYLELERVPLFQRYTFQCKGRILCRLNAGTRALHALVVRLKESQARFYTASQEYVPCVDPKMYKNVREGGAFIAEVEFEVSSMSDTIDIKIDGITQRAKSISNCPYSISDLVYNQGLHYVFGRPDHKRRAVFSERSTKRRRYR
jgi:hypothetical protein